MLTQITLIIEICDVVETLPAFVFNGDFEHATYDYEGCIAFCNLVPTDKAGIYTNGDNAMILGEDTHGDPSIHAFYTKIAGMSAYEFLSTYVFNDPSGDFNFITFEDGPPDE